MGDRFSIAGIQLTVEDYTQDRNVRSPQLRQRKQRMVNGAEAAAGDSCPVNPLVKFPADQLPPLALVVVCLQRGIAEQSQNLIGRGADLGSRSLGLRALAATHNYKQRQ